MRKITVLDFANQIGVLSDEVPVVVKTDRKVIGRFRCLYEIPETAMPGVREPKIDQVMLRSDERSVNYGKLLLHDSDKLFLCKR